MSHSLSEEPFQHDAYGISKNSIHTHTRLVPPSLSAIQARDKDGRRLIRRARLHLIIRTLSLSALLTLVLVCRTALVALQYLLLAYQLLVCEVSPVLGKHVICRHARNMF